MVSTSRTERKSQIVSCMAVVGILAIAGCQTEDARTYSPNYRTVPIGNGNVLTKDAPMSKDRDDMVEASLLPEACVAPDTAEQALYLPSGCANNVNLQLIAYRQSDLIYGREMGPAMAEPVARAARNYIRGVSPDQRPSETPTTDIDTVRQ